MISDIISNKLKKKKITAFLDSLQAAVASLLAPLQLYGPLKETGKLKETLKYIHYLLFPSLTPNLFFQELDILNVNPTFQISYLQNNHCNKFKYT